MTDIVEVRTLVHHVTRLIELGDLTEARLLEKAGGFMEALIAQDIWLPADKSAHDPTYYQQHLLYADPRDRFSLVSFVWGPGQATPIHNHTVWGIIGMLRGAELSQRFRVGTGAPEPQGPPDRLVAGQIDMVSPEIGDIHQVRNAFDNQVSISIHLYGGNIGKIERSVFDPQTGAAKRFVSGYSSSVAAPGLRPG